MNRRDFLKLSGAAGGAGILYTKFGFIRRALAFTPIPTLDPLSIPKYVQPLVIPPAMPWTSIIKSRGRSADYYEIAVRQFQQQILPGPLPATTVWSYGSVNHAGTFNYPAFTIEAKYNRPVRIKWINDLKDPATGAFLPHLLPVDPTLHWANPPGGITGRDTRPTFTDTPGPYDGPVPMISHVHGAHTYQESDGYPEAWYLPAANNIPAGYATTGTYYDIYKSSSPFGSSWTADSVVFEYPNDQRAATLWYHDHTLGMTRLNVYAGPAGFFLLRGGMGDTVLDIRKGTPAVLPGPAPIIGSNPFGTFYEIPIGIQDRSFNDDGSLFFPDSRYYFDEFSGPYIPYSDVSPIYNSEFFGETMVVNGRTWPYLNVEQRRYRFRFLNGCNARTLLLQFDNNLPFWQIGSEGGFLPAPVQLQQLLLSLAERADVIVDFSMVPVGTTITLLNLGPDMPFSGDLSEPANPDTTGQVMQFRVVKSSGADKSTPPQYLGLPAITPLGPENNTRQVSLNEVDSEVLPDVGPAAAFLGLVDLSGSAPAGVPHMWMDNITETVSLGNTEVWEIYNFTGDAHPIHVHLVMFQVVNREVFDPGEGVPGTISQPQAWETGWKDTVLAYPGQITRIKANFDRAGRYVWHCHIIDHEDNEMMRPYEVQ